MIHLPFLFSSPPPPLLLLSSSSLLPLFFLSSFPSLFWGGHCPLTAGVTNAFTGTFLHSTHAHTPVSSGHNNTTTKRSGASTARRKLACAHDRAQACTWCLLSPRSPTWARPPTRSSLPTISVWCVTSLRLRLRHPTPFASLPLLPDSGTARG